MDKNRKKSPVWHAPSDKGVPAVRPNSPPQRDEKYRAPAEAKNQNVEYELLESEQTQPEPGEFYY